MVNICMFKMHHMASPSVDLCSIGQVVPHKSKRLDMWKSSKAFKCSNLL
jgi:hypothetical protein